MLNIVITINTEIDLDAELIKPYLRIPVIDSQIIIMQLSNTNKLLSSLSVYAYFMNSILSVVFVLPVKKRITNIRNIVTPGAA